MTDGGTSPADQLPLSFGVPTVPAGFIDTIPDRPTTAGARGNAQDLGDFISFDDLPALPPRPPPSTAAARPRSEHWCPSRRYDDSSPLLRLHEEVLDFARAFRPTRAEAAMRRDLVRRVKAVVATVWPAATVRIFGSYDTDLYLPESDIDLVCIGTGVGASARARGKELHRLGAALGRVPWRAAQLEVVDKARVPIVKFVDSVSGVAVDICLEETSGLQSSNLARKATRTFPAYRPLVLLLKRWLDAAYACACACMCMCLHVHVHGSAWECMCRYACVCSSSGG